MRMCKPSIGTGLHAVTWAEINTAATPDHVRRGISADHAHIEGFWPENRSNRSLREALCDDCDWEHCEVRNDCKFGREAQRRVDAGEMAPCFGLRKREVAS